MTSQLMHSNIFEAKPLRKFNIGTNTIMLYPPITSSMSPAEKAHAFNTNKNALENLQLSHKNMIRSLGDTLNCSAVVTFTAAEFERVAYKQLREKIETSTTTYHSANGYLIPEAVTTDSNNNQVLKPTDDHLENEEKIRPDGIQYAKLCSMLNFKEVDPNHTVTYKFNWFHQLPMKPKKVIVSKSGDTPLVEKMLTGTFIGQTDWATSKTKRNMEENWDHPAANPEPFDLTESNIKDKNCNAETNINSAKHRLENIIFTAAGDTIKKKIFNTLCPNYIDDPTSAIIKIKQVYEDPTNSSKSITSSVSDYHYKLLQLMEQMGTKDEFTIDVVHHFYQNLAPKIKDKVKLNGYRGDSAIHSRKPYEQLKALNELFEYATTAEYEISKQKDEINEVLNNHHTFLSIPAVNLSTAERAIQNHKEPYIPTCWGCGGQHSWWSTATKNVTCPHKDNPEFQAKAAARFEAHKDKKKKKQSTYKRKKRVETMISSLLEGCDSDDDSSDTNTKLAEALITKLSPKKSMNKKPRFTPASTFTLFYDIIILQSATKPCLDINVHKNLPHFSFHIGSQKSEFHPSLQPAYDTCAALNCGYLPYHAAIAKAYPALVKNISYAGNDYSPIILKGVVNKDNNSTESTTALTAVIEYYTPYTTAAGHETTFKIALGNNISANLIMGLSTIKAGKFQYDPSDDTISSQMLENFNPTTVVYRNTTRGLPNNTSKAASNQNLNMHCKNIVQLAHQIESGNNETKNMDNTKVHITNTTNNSATKEANTNKNVQFSFINHGDTTPYFG